MIDIDNWIRELDEEEETAVKDNEEYQRSLFCEYVLRKNDNLSKRKELQSRYLSGENITGEKGLRKELAAFDLSYFGRAYLPHYFVRKSPAFHEELDAIWEQGVMKGRNPLEKGNGIDRLKGSRNVLAAPRGHAKSTNFTFKDSLHAVLYRYKHYLIIISDSSDQAEGFLEDIRNELEENYNIIQDFGYLKGEKAWNTKTLLTNTDIKVEALGSGKKIRGRRHRNWRPDLLVLDDIENDENVNTPEQRRKLDSWFKKAVSKCGDTYTDIMYIGTVLHYDSLLANTLKNTGYRSKTYRSIESWAKNQQLWDEWENIYTNLFNDTHAEDAERFFQQHKQEMLEGTCVLWEEKWSYYDLMKMRIDEGIASFNSEMMNEPIDPDSATFNEEWYDYYEEDLVDFTDPDFVIVGSNDPSLGKNKKSDTSAIISLAVSLTTGYMYVVEASVEKRTPDVIIQDVIDTQRRFKRDLKKGYYKFGVETVQFQYFFKTVMAEKSREQGEYIPIEEIQSLQNKQLRIESLQPLIKNKYIKFSRKHKALLTQLNEYPMGRNDDAPDCLQMAVKLAMSIKGQAKKIKYETVIRRRARFLKGAF